MFAWNNSLLDDVLEIAIIFLLFSKRCFNVIKFSKLSKKVINAYSSISVSSNSSLNSFLKLNEDNDNSSDLISDSSFSLTNFIILALYSGAIFFSIGIGRIKSPNIDPSSI